MTDKALIEKAFEKWCKEKCSNRHDCLECNYPLCSMSWLACATWQREQLEAEIKELKAENTKYRKEQELIQDYNWGKYISEGRGYNKPFKAWTKDELISNLTDQTIKLKKELKSTREQLIKELREWVNSNEGRIETDGKTWYKLVNGTDLLAKLDLLEGENKWK